MKILSNLMDRHIRGGKTVDEAKEWVKRIDLPNARVAESTKVNADVIIERNHEDDLSLVLWREDVEKHAAAKVAAGGAGASAGDAAGAFGESAGVSGGSDRVAGKLKVQNLKVKKDKRCGAICGAEFFARKGVNCGRVC